MGVKINSFGIEVPGHVTRTKEGDTTTLTLNAKQAQVVHDATKAVLDFVALQEQLPLDIDQPKAK
jgi:hypothetical protein